MTGRLKLSELADWLHNCGYEVSGPVGDDRDVIVTIDEIGGVHLSVPPG